MIYFGYFLISLFTFILGYNNILNEGVNLASLLLISITPILSFSITWKRLRITK